MVYSPAKPWSATRGMPASDRAPTASSVTSMATSELVFLVEESPEGGYTARALGEAIFTEADDLDGLREMVRDAVVCHFDEEERPRVVRLHLVRDELLAV
jgi:hypothetical protein